MSNTKEIVEKTSKSLIACCQPSKEVILICKWQEKKQEADNGLGIAIHKGTNAIGCINFELKSKSTTDIEYRKLLSAKIFETFGVYNMGVAAAAFSECINCIVSGSDVTRMEPDKMRAFLEMHCENVLSLFQEMRPRDPLELIIVTKMIILDYLSNREFIGSIANISEEIRTARQIRGIKLSRLLLEFKDNFDKRRKPEQQIHVQHNHIYNEGQAIIGSQLSTGGGRQKN